MNWQADEAIAAIVSSIAIVASAIFVVVQLRQAARDRYFTITSHLFEIWQSTEFREDELFLLHKFTSRTWEEFIADGRGERAERAFHRVGGFYDRVGNLIRHKLIDENDILPTIGGFAIAVWHRIEPLVIEARIRENVYLFQNFESVLPTCHECVVPTMQLSGALTAAAPTYESAPSGSIWRDFWFSRQVSIVDFRTRRINPAQAKQLIEREGGIILDVTWTPQRTKIRNAIRPSPRDLAGWLAAIKDVKNVVTYCT